MIIFLNFIFLLPFVLFDLHLISITIFFSDTKIGKPVICGQKPKSITDNELKMDLQFYQTKFTGLVESIPDPTQHFENYHQTPFFRLTP